MNKSHLVRLKDAAAALGRRTQHTPSHHRRWWFHNPYDTFRRTTFRKLLRWILIDRRRGQRIKKKVFYNPEMADNGGLHLQERTDDYTVTWIGHSTLLIQLGGLNILTDPVWSDRVSPLPFFGPRRYIEAGIAFEDLPPIDVVLLSHNHYDHFDKATIKRLTGHTMFIVPLRFGAELKRIGITTYHELDWWHSFTYRGVEFTCTPAQHYSNRRFVDHRRTLWCSWIGRTDQNNFFFAGDTGYFPGFKEVGDRFGPIDLVCLPIGAYLPRKYLGHVHMSPEEAVHAYHDLKGQLFCAIHWGTYNLGSDPPHLAPQVLMKEIERRKLDRELFWPFKHGETRTITRTVSW